MRLSEAERFVHEFHSRRSGVTAAVLADPQGDSSYARLAEELRGHARLLDLGCGDGPLCVELRQRGHELVLGVDFTEAELVLARRTGAKLALGKAQQLPLATAGLDGCACHMALMLFAEPELVVAEVARVLRPGGMFAAVIALHSAAGDAGALFLRLAEPALRRLWDSGAMPRLGDDRTRNETGLTQLLVPAGFHPPRWLPFTVELGGDEETVWQRLRGYYDVDLLAEQELAALRERWHDELDPLRAPDGSVPFHMPLCLITARRTG